jgi:hypothetical protein
MAGMVYRVDFSSVQLAAKGRQTRFLFLFSGFFQNLPQLAPLQLAPLSAPVLGKRQPVSLHVSMFVVLLIMANSSALKGK